MPNGHGGKRAGSGRKPKDLYTKITEGNRGHRPLKKVEFSGDGGADSNSPPDYLHTMRRVKMKDVPTPIEIYHEVVKYLEPTECMKLIPPMLISDYVMAKYYLLCTQRELAVVPTVVEVRRARPERGEREVYEITEFAEAMLKLQKNVLACWSPIWDIVSRNCQKLIEDPEQDLVLTLIGGRKRKETSHAKS